MKHIIRNCQKQVFHMHICITVGNITYRTICIYHVKYTKWLLVIYHMEYIASIQESSHVIPSTPREAKKIKVFSVSTFCLQTKVDMT